MGSRPIDSEFIKLGLELNRLVKLPASFLNIPKWEFSLKSHLFKPKSIRNPSVPYGNPIKIHHM